MKGMHLRNEHDVVSYIELNLDPSRKTLHEALAHDSYKYLGKHDNMIYGEGRCSGWVLEVTTLRTKTVSYVGVYVMDDDHRKRFILIRNRTPENYYANTPTTEPGPNPVAEGAVK
jgi:hypothetical protein